MIRPREEIINELVSTNLTQHQLTLLVQLLASLPSHDGRDDQRDAKARAAERARQYRLRNKEKSGMAGQTDAAGASHDERDASRDAALILSSSFLPLKKEEIEEVRKEESKKERARNKRKPAVPLPADWQPKPAHYAKAKALGRPDGFVDSKAEDLRIWAQANDARKQDWDATFHGFIRRDNGVSNGQRAPVRTVQDSARELAARARAALDRFNEPAPGDSGIRDGAGGPDVRLLPKG